MATEIVSKVTVREIDDAFYRARSTDTMVTMHDASTRQIWHVLPSGRVTVREHDYVS